MKKLSVLMAIAAVMFAIGCGSYDDSALSSRMDNLENRVAKLETLCQQMNTNIDALQTLVNATQGGDYITSVTPVTQNGVEIGYTITFAKRSPITIYHGSDGAKGEKGDDGYTPVIGVRQDYDGIYYWTLDGKWLTDDYGNKIKAEGKDGQKGDAGENGNDGAQGPQGPQGDKGDTGAKGDDGITPQLKIEDGYWYISYDNGLSWQQLGKATGENGKDGKDGSTGDSMFKSVSEDDDNVYFELASGTTITIPKGGAESQFAIEFDSTDISVLGAGETTTVNYTITAATDNTVVKAIAQNGWTATVVPTSVSAGSIKITAPDPLTNSEILVFANDGSYRTVMAVLDCSQGTIIVANTSFEISADGGTQQVKLQTNIDYTVNIPNDAKNWISVADTRAMRDETLTFTIQPNSAITERFATVTLNGGNGAVLESIIFRQPGTAAEGMIEIHVETVGTLQQQLASYDKSTIEAMKITGVLNDRDFLQIYHEMPSLRTLDISEVNITSLPNRSFYQSGNVENLILPKTLTTIPDEVFYQSAVKNIVLNDNLISIGASAFEQCKGLTSINIPASVETIGASAFADCTALSVVIFADQCALTALNSKTFYYCSLLTSIRIPAKVAAISADAFNGCNALQSVSFESNSELTEIANSTFASFPALQSIEIPANVETIGESAFKGCQMLSNVTFDSGSKLKNIKGGNNSSTSLGAFDGCSSLAKITIPSSVENIGPAAFKNCTKLSSIVFEKESHLKEICGTVDNYNLNSTMFGAFQNCKALTSIEIPASVETIGPAVFQGTQLATITFEKNSKLKLIDGGAYSSSYFGAFYATPLTSITIPSSVESIGQTAFKNCTSLTSVKFEKDSRLTAISGGYYSKYSDFDYGTFSGCIALTAIEIPANVETIGQAAFKGCSNLSSVTFESGSKLATIDGYYGYYYNTYYYYGAFSNCSSLSSIEFPANVTTIQAGAFSNCSKLEEINFLEGSLLNSIGERAFYNCATMHYFYATNCTVLRSIGSSAFANNDQIWYFEIGAPTPPQCGYNPFGSVGTYSVLKVPAGTVDAYKAASGWESFASISEIGK